MIKQIIEWFCRPFKKEFALLFSLTLLASTASVYYWILYGDVVFAVYLGLHGYLMCYLIALVYSFIGIKVLKAVYATLFLILGFISIIVDIVCHHTLHVGFTKDMVAIIMGTNAAETGEFIETFFTGEVIGIFMIVVIALIITWIFRTQIDWLGNKFRYAWLGVLFVGTAAIVVKQSNNWEGVYLYKIKTLLSYSAPEDLKQYLQNPQLEQKKERGPQNVVLVIGESFSKSHSSLYGYSKQTNPLLETLRDDSLLHVFKHIDSAELGTILSFQCIMSTYKPEWKDSVNWYECVTLPEIISKTGYKSVWISNQSRNGAYDNIVSKYAELCDTSYWCGQKFSGIMKYDLDGVVLEQIEELLKERKEKNFFVVHLMGSHYSFSGRYPANYGNFKADDYESYSENQRGVLAEYDNSILYNDYVIHEICSQFGDKEAIVIYFPDHGLDVYDSDEEYVGHARTTIPASVEAGRKIPFVIYTLTMYQQNFPKETLLIKNAVERPYRTDDVLYTIMDIIGIKFKENNDVEKYSLLTPVISE